jgi:hypothetical protein
MPKPKDPQDETSEGAALTVGGQPVKKLVTVAKPYKGDIPDLANRMAELAAKAKSEGT